MLIDLDDKVICNGALVEESHVITTCSCIRAGFEYVGHARVRIESYGVVAISEMFCHQKYSERGKHFDLAVIRLEEKIVLSITLIPACLASNWTENLFDVLVKTLHVAESFGKLTYLGNLFSKSYFFSDFYICRRPHDASNIYRQ